MDAVLLEQHKLSFSAFEILCWLLETEPQSIRALSGELVSVSPTRASRLVQDLIDAGHLQRGADQGDGRVSLISFTESGRHFAETAKRSFEESVKKYFVDPLDDDDIAALTRHMGQARTRRRPGLSWLAARRLRRTRVALVEELRASRREMADPRPGYWSMRFMLTHDTVHARSSPQRS